MVVHWIGPHGCQTSEPVRAGRTVLVHAETLVTSAATSSHSDAPLIALAARCTREGYAPSPTRLMGLRPPALQRPCDARDRPGLRICAWP